MDRRGAFVLLWAFTCVHAAEPPPLEAYGALPEFSNPSLSPSGKQLLLFRPIGDTVHLTVIDLDARRNRIVLAADPKRFLFNDCTWKNDERIVCSVRGYTERPTPLGPVRLVETRLYAVNSDGSGFLDLVPDAISREGCPPIRNSQLQDNVVSWLRADPEHILVALDPCATKLRGL